MSSNRLALLAILALAPALIFNLGNGASESKQKPPEDESWPAHRFDAARSAVTSALVPETPRLLWSHEGPAPAQAWPEPGRALNVLDFDYAPQPVMDSQRVYLGSSSDDCVRALDLATGAVVWTFATGGPVRFAPHLAGGNCYFAADDGFVTCVEAATGKLVWQFRAALNSRQVLANGRMTSRWPCRSGVLVHEGVVYTTAGMWPSEGVYLFALDAKSGQVLWCNDTSCYDYIEYPHAPSTSFGGPAPQGYLLLGNETLVVPTGRGAPAGYDARTGKLLHFLSNSSNRGGTRMSLAQDRIFVTAVAWQPDQVVRLGESVPHRADSLAALAVRNGKEDWPLTAAVKEVTDELKLPRWRSQIGHGIYGRQHVLFRDRRFYTLGNGKADAFEITGEKTVRRLWSIDCPRVYSEALTGNALLVGTQDRLLLLDPETGKTRSEAAIPGQVRGLAVASGRIVATTEAGHLYVLGGAEAPRPAPATRAVSPAPDTRTVGVVADLLRAHCPALPTRGFAVVAGDTDARLAQELANRSRLHVLCVLPDDKTVEAERQRLLRETNLHGSRVALVRATPVLPFVSQFANLVVLSGKNAPVPAGELYRILRPCGGRLVVLDSNLDEAGLRTLATAADEVAREGGGLFLRRGKLTGAFDWDSKVQADERVRWPLEFQWFGEPNGQLVVARHSRPRTPIPANGRLFVFGESHLTAVDIYNGSELWRRRVSAAVCTGQNPVAADDHALFITEGGTVWQLDAATGRILRAYGQVAGPTVHSLGKPFQGTAVGRQGEQGILRVEQDRDRIRIRLTTQSASPTRDDRWELAFDFRPAVERLQAPGIGTFEYVIDPWRGTRIPHRTLSHPEIKLTREPGDNEKSASVVLTLAVADVEKWLGRKLGDFALAADVKLWTEDYRLRLWGRPLVPAGKRGWLNESEAVMVAADQPLPTVGVPLAPASEMPALAAKPGRLPPMSFSRPDGDYSADFAQGMGQENPKPKESSLKRVLEFELLQRKHPLTGEDVSRDYSRSYGCSGTSCSATMDFFRSGTIGMADRLEDSGMRNISGIRSGCGQTLMPACGMLVYSESASDCLCSYSFATSLGLAPATDRRNEDWALFDNHHLTPGVIRQTALNLGAPGDRRDSQGTLWLGFPRPAEGLAKKMALPLPATFEVSPGLGTQRINTDRRPIENTDRPWLYGSCLRGVQRVQLDLVHHQPTKHLLTLASEKTPEIDGRLNDTCWDGFGALPLPDREANVYLRHDEQNLYLAFDRKPRTDVLGKMIPWKATVRGKDGNFERDDHFRVSLFNPKGHRVVTFAVTAGGGMYDALLDLGKDATLRDKRSPIPAEAETFDVPWQAKAKADSDGFRAEMAIPWQSLADAGISREGLTVECVRKSRWGGAKDATLLKLLENGVEVQALNRPPAARKFTLRLHFAELDDVAPGERVFDVLVQGQPVLKEVDVVREAGGRHRALVREVRDIVADRAMDIRLVPKARVVNERTAPILSALEFHSQ